MERPSSISSRFFVRKPTPDEFRNLFIVIPAAPSYDRITFSYWISRIPKKSCTLPDRTNPFRS